MVLCRRVAVDVAAEKRIGGRIGVCAVERTGLLVSGVVGSFWICQEVCARDALLIGPRAGYPSTK